MISGIGIRSPETEPQQKAIQGRDGKDMEGHEGIPSASIVLCLTVTSTFMPLHLIDIIKTQAMRIPSLENFLKSNSS